MFRKNLSINLLRFSLGFIFIWLGILKMFNASTSLEILKNSLPQAMGESQIFIFAVSFLEILIGIGLFLKRTYRFSALIMIILLAIITIAALVTQGFDPRFPVLSFVGEYSLKNLTLITAGIVILTENKIVIEDKEKSKEKPQIT